MSFVIGALQPVDWMNAVYVPLVLALTVGFSLAIYTGLICSRMILFVQTREQGALAVQQVWSELKNATDPGNLMASLGAAVNPARFSLHKQGHLGAALRVLDVFNCIYAKALELSGYDLTGISPIDWQFGRLPVLPLLEGPAWLEFRGKFVQHYIATMQDHSNSILMCRRNWIAILTTPDFARWLDKNIARVAILSPHHRYTREWLKQEAKKKSVSKI